MGGIGAPILPPARATLLGVDTHPGAEAPLAVKASLPSVSAGASIANPAAQPLTHMAPLLWLCPR